VIEGFPKVRALCQSVRRPTITMLVGFGLIAPAGAFVMYGGEAAATNTKTVLETGVDEVVEAEEQARDAVVMAWRQSVLDRERVRVSGQYAVRFRIPLDLADDIHWAARKERIDPHLAYRLVRAESSFRARAISPVGALGLTQVMPATATWLFPDASQEDLLEPRFNLRVGFRYLRYLLDTYDDATLALLAYNRGPGRVDSLLSAGEDPANGYPELVLTGDRTKHAEFVAAKRAAAEAAEEQRRRAAS